MQTPTQNEDLVPGSVWQRNAKGKSSEVTVLLVTNTTLSEQTQEKFPPQVVFVKGEGEVLSQTVDMFLSNRECVGVDESAANLVELLLNPEEENEEIDIDSIPLEDEGDSEDPALEVKDDEAAPAKTGALVSATSEATMASVFEPEVVQIEGQQYALNDHFVGFRTLPFGSGNMVQVDFKLEGALSRQALWDIFTDLGTFTVDSSAETLTLDIAEVVSVEIGVDSVGTVVGTVYLETKAAQEPTPEVIDRVPQSPAIHTAPVLLQQVAGAPAAQLAVTAG